MLRVLREGCGVRVIRPVRADTATANGAHRWAAWRCYLLGGTLLAGAYFAFPHQHLLLWAPLGGSAVVATIVGVRRNRPASPAAWYLFAAAQACFICGDTTYNVLTDVLHRADPFPSLADAFYLPMYPLIALGLLALLRARTVTHDRGSLLDALTISTGLGLLSWVYLILPYVHAGGLTVIQRAISIAYPLGDVLVMALLARLVTSGVKIRSLQFLVLGATGLLVSDVAYGWIQLNGSWQVGGPVDAGWVIYYLGWGAAALHPSMSEVSRPLPVASGPVRGRKIVVLALVSLIAPAVLLTESLSHTASHAGTIAVFSGVLYLLVVTRLAGIVGTHQASIRRERTLRTAGESLVAARSLTDVYDAAVAAVNALAGDCDVMTATIYRKVDDGIRTVAGNGPPHDRVLDDWARWRSAGTPTDAGRLSVSPLCLDQDLQGLLVVRTRRGMTTEVHGALSTLASQVALALEGAALADEVRRRQNDAHFKALIQNASDIIVVLSADGMISYGTPSLERWLGRSPDQIRGTRFVDLLHPEDAGAAEHHLRSMIDAEPGAQPGADWRLSHGDGSYRSFEIMFSNLLDDTNVGGIVLTMRDVSERRALEEQLTHQAFHDALTGLANRALFHDRAEQVLSRRERRGGHSAMMMFDLDDFKVVNDTLGHAAGDELLMAIARRLLSGVRIGDTVARLGGDEFAVLMDDVHDLAEAETVAARLVDATLEPFQIFGEELRMGASAGLVIIGSDLPSTALSELLKKADLALYAAKERGKGRVVTYVEELHVHVLDRAAHKSDLTRALEAGQFALRYQPILAIETGDVVGAEALVRWEHPRRGLLAPGEFVDLAEETGMIVELGYWVLAEALATAGTWRRAAGRPIRLSVNVSGRQLQEPDFVATVSRLLADSHTRPDEVIMEITESVLVRDGSPALAQMTELHAHGVGIAIDDFGVGYSSLAYLQDFPVDFLKIDKSFVRNLGRRTLGAAPGAAAAGGLGTAGLATAGVAGGGDTGPAGWAVGGRRGGQLASAVVSLAQSLRLEVIAEGIERTEQRDALQALGCSLGQGHLYAEPLNALDFVRILTNGARLGPPATRFDQGNGALAHDRSLRDVTLAPPLRW
jgi:diguanylate cyclase (GGDEF)-like protein/PAS domain S-box-containing protein